MSTHMRCLGNLSRGLALAKADDPMLYVERQGYLSAMGATVYAIELARVTLAKARQRIERSLIPQRE